MAIQPPPQTAKEWLAIIQAEEGRRHLRDFIPLAWPIVEPTTPFMPNWHIDAISEHLEAVSRGEIRNLLINMPPRCAKSTIVSVMWPVWTWATTPAFRWLFASYALSLAIRDSLKCRRIIESDWYQRHYGDMVQLAPDQNLKSRFENSARGYRYAVSVGSSVTGEGGDAIVVDDAHNAKMAGSALIRESTLDWWDQAISSRLNDPRTGCKVIVMQRLHERDLSAHVLEKGDYVHLCLPLEYEANTKCVTALGWEDPRRLDGELLWPERIGPTEVAQLKIALGVYGYAGQYQQRPTPRAGGTFQQAWMGKRYRTLPQMPQVIQAVDSAFKEGVANDYSVIATWGTDGIGYYLINIWRDRVDFPGLIQAIRDQAAAHAPSAILVEDKASGQSAIQMLHRTTALPVIAVAADGSKESRADLISPLFEAGRVYLPESAEWLAAWIDEHVHFPRGAHDDQCDTTSYALRYLSADRGGRIRFFD
ncbi:MAG: phage terminase large subunit [Rhodospirillales bacterium]|nr:phage terminase large subunit [Rhodospirillales bacterium]